jgi:hypothetical protein
LPKSQISFCSQGLSALSTEKETRDIHQQMEMGLDFGYSQ